MEKVFAGAMWRLLSSPSDHSKQGGRESPGLAPALLDDFLPTGERAEKATVNYSLVQGWAFHISSLRASPLGQGTWIPSPWNCFNNGRKWIWCIASKNILINLRVIKCRWIHGEHRFGKLKGCGFASSTSFLDAATESQECLIDPETGRCSPLNHAKKINEHFLW